jgi:hypothetical protein
MENNITIRNMTESDIAEVSSMMAELHRIHRELRPDIYIETEKPFGDSDLIRGIADPERFTLVAEIDNNIIGFCVITNKTPQNPLCVRRKIAFIEAIYVREDMRRRGIVPVIEIPNLEYCISILSISTLYLLLIDLVFLKKNS